jgi:hypothetical protein
LSIQQTVVFFKSDQFLTRGTTPGSHLQRHQQTEPACLLVWLKTVSAFLLQHSADPTQITPNLVHRRKIFSIRDFPRLNQGSEGADCCVSSWSGSRRDEAKFNLDLMLAPIQILYQTRVPPSLRRGLQVEGQLRDGIVRIDQGRTKTAPIRESLTGNGKGKKVGRSSWLEKICGPSLSGKAALD